MQTSRRRTVLWLAGLSLAVVATAAILGRRLIIETWYIYQLDSEDVSVTDNAALELIPVGSARAVQALLKQIPRELAKGRSAMSQHASLDYWTDSAVVKALHELGPEARTAARQAFEEGTKERELLRRMHEGTKVLYSKTPPVQRIERLDRKLLRESTMH